MKISDNALTSVLRYYWAITPRNYVGAACSFFLASTGVIQAVRRLHYDAYISGTEHDPRLAEEELE